MIRISTENRTCSGEIRLPASKSISNRLLLLQFYYNNSFRIYNLSDSDDTVLLSSILDLIRQYKLRGDTGLLRVDSRNAGSVLRFMVPLLSVTPGHYLLTGSERMHQRPIGALVEALRESGAEINYLENVGFPPLLIRGRAISGDRIRLDASLSSQFVTALLLLAPTLADGLTIELTDKPVSWPYVMMTAVMLSALGVQVIVQDNAIRVFHKKEIKTDVNVEADWSAASFWYCMLSLAEKGEVFLPGLRRSGLQGDQQLVSLFRELGVESFETGDGIRIAKSDYKAGHFNADFSDYPDLALPVILACGAAGIPGTFTGLERLRIKESDRIEAISSGMIKAGLALREEPHGKWNVSGHLLDPCDLYIDDFDDHRVTMTFACLALKGFNVHLGHPGVVNKSYPGFWKDLEKTGFNCIL